MILPGMAVLVQADARKLPLPDSSIDAICCDPPYGLEFMGKQWDRPWAVEASASVGYAGRDDLKLPQHRDSRNANCRACGGRQRGAKRCGCPAPQWDRHPREDMRAFQAWCEEWAREALRVLKPGGHAVCFGGTRTYHRLVCGLEDAGFEIRDSLHWMYSSGFPKGGDVGKTIDKMAPRRGMFDAFAEHLRERRTASGLTQKDIARHFPSKTGGMTGCVWNWENGATVPTRVQWAALQPMLGLSDEWGPLIERVEADREVTGRSAHHSDGRRTAIWGASEQGRDITAPATPEAVRWTGWSPTLKPAHEPIVLARKPLVGTIAANVLAYGTGALNVDACRVSGVTNSRRGGDFSNRVTALEGGDRIRTDYESAPGGRWPPNLLLSHSPGCVQTGTRQVRGSGSIQGGEASTPGADSYGFRRIPTQAYAGADGLETVPAWTCAEGCPVALLDAQSGNRPSGGSPPGDSVNTGLRGNQFARQRTPREADSGGASRYFPQFPWDPEYDYADQPAGYQALLRNAVIEQPETVRGGVGDHQPDSPPFRYVAKASTRERNEGLGGDAGVARNSHPT